MHEQVLSVTLLLLAGTTESGVEADRRVQRCRATRCGMSTHEDLIDRRRQEYLCIKCLPDTDFSPGTYQPLDGWDLYFRL